MEKIISKLNILTNKTTILAIYIAFSMLLSGCVTSALVKSLDNGKPADREYKDVNEYINASSAIEDIRYNPKDQSIIFCLSLSELNSAIYKKNNNENLRFKVGNNLDYYDDYGKPYLNFTITYPLEKLSYIKNKEPINYVNTDTVRAAYMGCKLLKDDSEKITTTSLDKIDNTKIGTPVSIYENGHFKGIYVNIYNTKYIITPTMYYHGSSTSKETSTEDILKTSVLIVAIPFTIVVDIVTIPVAIVYYTVKGISFIGNIFK